MLCSSWQDFDGHIALHRSVCFLLLKVFWKENSGCVQPLKQQILICCFSGWTQKIKEKIEQRKRKILLEKLHIVFSLILSKHLMVYHQSPPPPVVDIFT